MREAGLELSAAWLQTGRKALSCHVAKTQVGSWEGPGVGPCPGGFPAVGKGLNLSARREGRPGWVPSPEPPGEAAVGEFRMPVLSSKLNPHLVLFRK